MSWLIVIGYLVGIPVTLGVFHFFNEKASKTEKADDQDMLGAAVAWPLFLVYFATVNILAKVSK